MKKIFLGISVALVGFVFSYILHRAYGNSVGESSFLSGNMFIVIGLPVMCIGSAIVTIKEFKLDFFAKILTVIMFFIWIGAIYLLFTVK